MEHLFYFILLALLAEILGTLGGFGSSLFFVPIASYFLDLHSVLGVTALFHVFSNLTKIALFRRGFDRTLVFTMGIPAILFVILGAYLSAFIATQVLEKVLAVVLMAVSILLLFLRNYTLKANTINSVSGGAVSGLIAGLVGTGGAIRGAMLSAFGLRIEVFIATSAIIDLGIDVSRSVVYFFNGYVHRDDLYLIPILFLVSLTGTFIAKQLLVFISEKQFKILVLVLVFITGIMMLIRQAGA